MDNPQIQSSLETPIPMKAKKISHKNLKNLNLQTTNKNTLFNKKNLSLINLLFQNKSNNLSPTNTLKTISSHTMPDAISATFSPSAEPDTNVSSAHPTIFVRNVNKNTAMTTPSSKYVIPSKLHSASRSTFQSIGNVQRLKSNSLVKRSTFKNFHQAKDVKEF